MKKVTLTIALLFALFTGFAQSAGYQKDMIALVSNIHANSQQTELMPFANKMERIAAAEAEEWLPNYWLAYCFAHDNFRKQDSAEKDQLLELAEKAIEKAEELSEEHNAEIAIMKAQIASARMSVDPMNRYQEYGEKFQKAIQDAIRFDAGNPRIYYLQGTSAFYTPENFGGGKAIAKPLFEKALEKFNNFELESAIYPNWGSYETEYFLTQCK
jgi:uncharacterized protein (DUF4415 family)